MNKNNLRIMLRNLMGVFLYIVVSCTDEHDETKQVLSKNELFNYLESNADYRKFIHLHLDNIIAIHSITPAEMAKFENINSDNASVTEQSAFLKYIGFQSEAYEYYNRFKSTINFKVSFKESDLKACIKESLLLVAEIGRADSRKELVDLTGIINSVCDAVCTEQSNTVFPYKPDDPDRQMVSIQRNSYYAGCMWHCKYGSKND